MEADQKASVQAPAGMELCENEMVRWPEAMEQRPAPMIVRVILRDGGGLVFLLLFTLIAPSVVGVLAWLGGELVGGRSRKSWGAAFAAYLATGLAMAGPWFLHADTAVADAVIFYFAPCLAASA